MCAAKNLAANRRREAISTDVRIHDAISSNPCGSGDEIELVPKQPHFIEAELAPKPVSWTGLMRLGPKRLFSFYRVKLLSAYPVLGTKAPPKGGKPWGLRLRPKGESPGD